MSTLQIIAKSLYKLAELGSINIYQQEKSYEIYKLPYFLEQAPMQ